VAVGREVTRVDASRTGTNKTGIGGEFSSHMRACNMSGSRLMCAVCTDNGGLWSHICLLWCDHRPIEDIYHSRGIFWLVGCELLVCDSVCMTACVSAS